MASSSLYIGAARALGAKTGFERLMLPSHHLVTHGCIVGTTGSGKTGLITVAIEEALRNEVPVLVIDVKGDLPNLLLAFPTFSADAILPWIEGCASPADQRSPEEIAAELGAQRQAGLTGWGIEESVYNRAGPSPSCAGQ